MKIKYLEMKDFEKMKELFRDVFSSHPWFDKWDNQAQLDAYLKDLTDNTNSLSLALYDERHELIGCSLGYIFNWWEGREYFIKEFFIAKNKQNQGAGRTFLHLADRFLQDQDVACIILATEKHVPAFQFYQNNGFSVLENSVHMVKRVTQKEKG
ncbi:GNAT family N-acetyltransferase [Shouchella sp. 1P09AA]|uniref:GNAT family N-acetyltransferase n=1 Tax=unclassified Shouchella TaxID=2893065 RepID=UPI0039A2AB91